MRDKPVAFDIQHPQDRYSRFNLMRKPCTNISGCIALHQAASHGHLEVVKCLLAHGASIDTHTQMTGSTALHQAASHGHLEVVKCLLMHGASVDVLTISDATPLMEAAWNGHLGVVQILNTNRAKT